LNFHDLVITMARRLVRFHQTLTRSFMATSSRLLLPLILVMVLLAMGCRKDAEDLPRPSVEEALEELDSAREIAKPLKPEDLAPRIAAIGPDGAVPRLVAIELARPVVESAPRMVRPDTVWTIDPPVEGALEFQSPTSLQFTPSAPFRPATTYRVSLQAIESPDGVLRPEAPWSHSFTTPAFSLLSLSTAIWEQFSGTITVHAAFSAPVDAAQMSRFASWKADGRSLSGATYKSGADPHVVRIVFRGVRVRPSSLELSLQAGLPYDDTLVAPAATMRTTLAEGPPMRILSARLTETPAGFAIELVCDDEGSTLPSRYYWDQASFQSHYVSGRCFLDREQARRSLRIATSGRVVEDIQTSPTQGGFRVLADLSRGPHTLRIDAGARTVDGGILYEPFEWTFEVGPRTPSMNFVAVGRYLPRGHWRNIALRHRNIGEVELTIRHVPPQNLSFWLTGEDETVDGRTSRVVARTRVALRGPDDRFTTSFVDLAAQLPDPEPGVYEIRASAPGFNDSIRLMVTDLNLIAKRHAPASGMPYSRRYHVSVLHMQSNALLSGVTVEAVRASGEVLASCATASDGTCHLALPEDPLDDAPPIALLARRGHDLTYLRFDDLQTRDTRARTDGEAYLAASPYRATIYGDRGVYRPGESAHVVALIRDRRNLAPKEGLPVELRVFDARQREILRRNLTTNPAGAVTLSVGLADFAVTGAYTVQARVADQVLSTHRFHVEEFVPERLRVTTEAMTSDYLASEEKRFAIEAAYLFGASAAGSKVELHCQLEAAAHHPAHNGQYHYGPPSAELEQHRAIDLGATTGVLDGQGKVELNCPPVPDAVVVDGPSRVVGRAAVFEAGSGRTSVAQNTARVHPGQRYVGLTSPNTDVRVGRPITVEGVVTDWEGLPVRAVNEVQVEFYRYDWNYNWFYDEETGRETRTRERLLTLDGRQTVSVTSGKFAMQITPGDIGSGYLIVAEVDGARTELLLEREGEPWQWYMESQLQRTPRPTRPAPVAIEGPDRLMVGAPTTITFTAPFKGKVLLTAETHEVLAAEWRDVDAGTNQWAFTVERFVPNVYVSALLVKDPHLESRQDFLPERAFGVRSFQVEPAEYSRPVRLEVPTTVRSRSSLRAEIDLGRLDEPTFATVAVVDEGVLSLTRFSSPDPLQGLFARRALGVDTFETVGWALRLPAGGTGSAPGGGDDFFDEQGPDGADGLGRTMPVRPVALWSGIVAVPDSGKLALDFDLPLYRGKLRVMAVTMGPGKIGRAEAEVLVQDPLTVQATLPRFLSPHDQAEVPVFVTNLTGSRATITVSLEAHVHGTGGQSAVTDSGPPLRVEGRRERVIDVDHGASQTVVFPLRALYQSGAARVVVRARSGAHEVYDEVVLPFVPPGPRQREVKRVALRQGANDLSAHLAGWVPTSEHTTVWVTAQPHAESFDHLRYLIRYPYGCLEQTTSTLRPMLFAAHILGQVDPSFASGDGELEQMIRSGLDRILSMRHQGGGFTYWPGASEVEPWSTTYATHLLLDADRQGYALPAGVLNEALTYLERNLAANHGGYTSHQETEPYAHYVLAMAGKGQRARILQLIGRLPPSPRGRQAEEAYMLKAALFLAGDRRFEQELRAVDVSPLASSRELGYPFYSDLRYRGFMLNVFFDLFGADPAAAPLAEQVARGLAGQRSGYFSTQELAWAMTGLGKWYGGLAASFGPARLMADGRELLTQTSIDGRADRSWSVVRASEYGKLELVVDRMGEGPLYALLSSEGVRTDGFVPLGGQGLAIEREYLDSEGNPLENHRLGDMVYSRITLTNTHGSALRNVALVDRVPAGWEIELTDLGHHRALPDWAQSDAAWEVAHINRRDDRIELFGDLARGQRAVFVYALRAVTSGQFHVPTIDAEAMYDPRIWARQAGATLRMDGPWEEYID
jgi:alpha-2-macroglobulin